MNSAAESVHGRLRFQKEILQAAQTERLQRTWFIILRAACTETLCLGWKVYKFDLSGSVAKVTSTSGFPNV
jgi:hypothetical protein